VTVKSAISLTDEQHSFVKELAEAVRYSSVIAVQQQEIDLLRQRMQDDDLHRMALKALLDQRSAGAFVSGVQMDKTIARMITEQRTCASDLGSRQKPSVILP
jgi:antitoxin ParD1/3/4